MAPNGSEIARLQADLDRLEGIVNGHLIQCAAANGRLAMTMRMVLIGMAILIVLVAPDNPIVKAGFSVMGVGR